MKEIWIHKLYRFNYVHSVENEMKGLEWNRLYETYHKKKYNPTTISASVQKLYADGFVKVAKAFLNMF